MVTTIQLNEGVKKALDRMKSNKETYEEVIINLMEFAEEHKKKQENLLIEGYKKMAEESLKIAKEWEGTLMDGLDKNEKWQI
jgi:predicted CopG family antitoxin